MKKVKVRFNLGLGKNYMKWKIEIPGFSPIYLDPGMTQLKMEECTVKNQRKTAEKIFQGAHKTVCAWILCDRILIDTPGTYPVGNTQLSYNPRVQPNWLCAHEIVDNHVYNNITTNGKNLFVELQNIS